MGRPPKFDVDQILDAAAGLVADGGPPSANVATIASVAGAPTGSIYHRFASRDLLLARLWIRTVERAQVGFLEALDQGALERAALDAALHIPRWSRRHLTDARILIQYRKEDLAGRWPEELRSELKDLNRSLELAIRDFTRCRYGRITAGALERTAFALVDVPYAGVRRHLLAGRKPPASVDQLVTRTVRCVLDGDSA